MTTKKHLETARAADELSLADVDAISGGTTVRRDTRLRGKRGPIPCPMKPVSGPVPCPLKPRR